MGQQVAALLLQGQPLALLQPRTPQQTWLQCLRASAATPQALPQPLVLQQALPLLPQLALRLLGLAAVQAAQRWPHAPAW